MGVNIDMTYYKLLKQSNMSREFRDMKLNYYFEKANDRYLPKHRRDFYEKYYNSYKKLELGV